MRGSAIVAVLWLAPLAPAADPPTAAVTGRSDGRAVTFPGGTGTVVQGLAIATFGSAQFERAADKGRWEAALRADHVLVKFPTPRGLAADIQGAGVGGKTYEVSELLVPTTLGTTDAPLARVGDKYLAFGKWDPSPIVLLRDRWGVGKPAQR